MNSRLIIFTSFFLLLFTSVCYGQNTADTISLEGNVNLDFGVASSDFEVEISVSNHSFVVISVFPVTIIRPLLSRVTESVTIAQGQSSVDYMLNGISTNAVDYVIDFRCDNCDGVFSPQYYTTNENSFSMSNAVYIDPSEFPNNLDFTLISGSSITGVISLAEGGLAKRDLNFLISALDPIDPNNIFRRISITIPKGSNSAAYAIDQLVRDSELTGFDVQLDCLNCLTTSILTINYPDTLDPLIDSTNINFEVDFNDISFLPATLYPLLNDAE